MQFSFFEYFRIYLAKSLILLAGKIHALAVLSLSVEITKLYAERVKEQEEIQNEVL